MLRQVFGVGREELSFAQVVKWLKIGDADSMPESELLDFKSELPQTSDKQAVAKLAKSIAALANGAGGVILCGVFDQDERASSLSPVALGNELTDLQRALNLQLSPVPSFSCIPIDKGDGTGLLAIEVLPSTFGPHAVFGDPKTGKPEFFVRQGRQNVPMREQEIERAYRYRFASRADTESRLDAVEAEVKAAINPGGLWLVAAPRGNARRVYDGPRDGLKRFERLAYDTSTLHGPFHVRIGGSTVTTRARRVVCFDDNRRIGDVCALSDDGILMAACHLPEVAKLKDSGWIKSLESRPARYLARTTLGAYVVTLLTVVRDVWKHFGIWEESLVRIGAHSGASLAWLSDPAEGSFGLLEGSVAWEARLSLGEMLTPGYIEGLVEEVFSEITAGFGILLPPVVDNGVIMLERIGLRTAAPWLEGRGLQGR